MCQCIDAPKYRQGSCDWLLKITKNGVAQPSNSALLLSVLSGIGSVSGESRIISQAMDPYLEEVVSQTEIGGSSLTSPGPTQVATEPMGNSLVVWQREGEEEMSIAGLVLDSQGAVLTPEFAIASGSSASPGHPTVTTLASGDFLVVWAGADEEGGGPWIRYATFDRFGAPLKPEQIAVNCKPVAGDFPQATSLGEGGFAIAWERSGGGIYVLQWDALGYPSDAGLGSEGETTVLEVIEDGADAPDSKLRALWPGRWQRGGGSRFGQSGDHLGVLLLVGISHEWVRKGSLPRRGRCSHHFGGGALAESSRTSAPGLGRAAAPPIHQ